ncbi:Alcohol acetyltransferase [Neodidymelliopsis sp. IMI 364377]|nr:Alcohol acetyltransferase [Neodidymelliopsis sp. IMI 364377]
MSGVTQLEKLRSCGRQETYSTARHHLGFYNNVGLSATYTAPSKDVTSLESLVFAALRHVVAEQPNLSAIPVNEDKSYPEVYFARLPEIDLRTCVEFREHSTTYPFSKDGTGDVDLDGVLVKEHDRSFKEHYGSRPCWRLIITSSSKEPGKFTASWIFHHAISDGVSAMLFHESFLTGLNAASSEKQIDPVVKVPKADLSPSLEDMHPMTISWSYFLRAVLGSILPSYFARRSTKLWTGEPVPPIVSQTELPTITTMVLSAAMTKAFAGKCHDEKTSVTAALSTYLAAAIFPFVAPLDELNFDVPISLRASLDIPEGQIANAITNHSFKLNHAKHKSDTTLQSFSWDTARQVKKELSEKVAKAGADNPFALLKYVSNIITYFTDKLGKPRDTSVEVSNIGKYLPRSTTHGHDIEETKSDKWSIGRMVFSQGLNRTSGQISVSVVTGGDECMAISFCWPQLSMQYFPDNDFVELMLRKKFKRDLELLAKS